LPVDSPYPIKDNRFGSVALNICFYSIFRLFGMHPESGGPMNLIWIGLGLMMVFEGIPYFCFPNQIKQLARKLPEVENSVLRWIGLALMLIGLTVVYLARGAIQNH